MSSIGSAATVSTSDNLRTVASAAADAGPCRGPSSGIGRQQVVRAQTAAAGAGSAPRSSALDRLLSARVTTAHVDPCISCGRFAGSQSFRGFSRLAPSQCRSARAGARAAASRPDARRRHRRPRHALVDEHAGPDFSPSLPSNPSPLKTAKASCCRRIWLDWWWAEPRVSALRDPIRRNGRMYVAEFTTYMRDADGNNQHVPESRIPLREHEERRRTTNARSSSTSWCCRPRRWCRSTAKQHPHQRKRRPTTSSVHRHPRGVVRQARAFLFGNRPRPRRNLEHEQAGSRGVSTTGFTTTYNAFASGSRPRNPQEPTGPNSGSWGVTMDDDGRCGSRFGAVSAGRGTSRCRFTTAASRWPINTSPDSTGLPGNRAVDTQGGMVRVRMPVGGSSPDRRLGRRRGRVPPVPDDLRCDLLITEPVGRLIRRARTCQDGGLTNSRNAYPGAEFLTAPTRCSGRSHHDRAGRSSTSRHVPRDHTRSRTGPGRDRTCGRKMSSISSQGSRTGGSGGFASWRAGRAVATPAGPAAQATPEFRRSRHCRSIRRGRGC